MSDKTGKMILIKDGANINIFDDKNMSDKVLMLDYPEGTNMEQLHKFYELIGKECEIVEVVHPKRLYTLTDVYEHPINGNVLIVGMKKRIRWNGILRNKCRAS